MTIRETEEFVAWRTGLRDVRAKALIADQIIRLGRGLYGDAKAVGGGVSELRIHDGPGYRIYFIKRGAVVIVLLCGGDKGSQRRDVARAKVLAAGLEE